MIRIQIPDFYELERYYIISVLLCEFLGFDIAIEISSQLDTLLTIDGSQKSLIVMDDFFRCSLENWLDITSLPRRPLMIWDIRTINLAPILVDSKIPVIYGAALDSTQFCDISENKITLSLDIFGSCFFMLTRYEEIVQSISDQHGRFPAKASLAFQEGFLDRPIVNEYVEILWSCMKRLWPTLERKKRQFKISPSHDVDQPFRYFFRSAKALSREISGDLIKRRMIKSTPQKIANLMAIKFGHYRRDPYYTFDWLMEQSEKYDVQSTFYFMACQPGPFDKGYSMFNRAILNLLKEINRRGHNIGLHPSYKSYENPQLLKQEISTLSEALEIAGVSSQSLGSRQHYLRWHPEKHWRYLSDAGISYDSTLGFPELPGFRTGSCYEYSVFDIVNRQHLAIREKPLILMDCTIIGAPAYMNLNVSDTIDVIRKLYVTVQKFQGEFVWLWHNSYLGYVDESFYSNLFINNAA